MSTLSDIIAKLESGGGAFASAQPSSMTFPVFGQYSGFSSQYGGGAGGIDNYASQVLQANPSTTFGQFYASYVLGTGNPSNLHTLSQLQNQYPAAYNNLTRNAGSFLNTPLSQLLGGGNVSDILNSAGNSAGNAVGSAISSTLAGVGNSFFSLNVAERTTAIVIGVILIGIAMVFLLGETKTGQTVIEQVKGAATTAATAAVAA